MTAAGKEVWWSMEPSPGQRIRLIASSGTLAFWDRQGEDIYSNRHGEPI
ncbi:MAG: hypothetical protein HY720_08540 [Planctomycetes bacterium]|nr:hypothetical protein [Planctomycetota bacterium]